MEELSLRVTNEEAETPRLSDGNRFKPEVEGAPPIGQTPGALGRAFYSPKELTVWLNERKPVINPHLPAPRRLSTLASLDFLPQRLFIFIFSYCRAELIP